MDYATILQVLDSTIRLGTPLLLAALNVDPPEGSAGLFS